MCLPSRPQHATYPFSPSRASPVRRTRRDILAHRWRQSNPGIAGVQAARPAPTSIDCFDGPASRTCPTREAPRRAPARIADHVGLFDIFERDGRGAPFRVARFGGAGAATGCDDFGLYHRLSQALSPSSPGISTRSVMFIWSSFKGQPFPFRRVWLCVVIRVLPEVAKHDMFDFAKRTRPSSEALRRLPPEIDRESASVGPAGVAGSTMAVPRGQVAEGASTAPSGGIQ